MYLTNHVRRSVVFLFPADYFLSECPLSHFSYVVDLLNTCFLKSLVCYLSRTKNPYSLVSNESLLYPNVAASVYESVDPYKETRKCFVYLCLDKDITSGPVLVLSLERLNRSPAALTKCHSKPRQLCSYFLHAQEDSGQSASPYKNYVAPLSPTQTQDIPLCQPDTSSTYANLTTCPPNTSLTHANPNTLSLCAPAVLTAYKRVDKKVRPVAGTFPEAIRVHRQYPHNPLATLPFLTKNPPVFAPTAKISEERMKVLNVNATGFLWPEEEKLIQHVMVLNEEGLAFEDAERGTFKQSYFSDYIIPTVPHIPWAFRNIPIPPGIKDKVIDVLKKKIDAGVYEPSQSSYRHKWFVVPKKSGKLRIVHDCQPLNKVTIKDAGLPPNLEDFVEPFAGFQCYTVFDLFWGFDARKLHPDSRDLTAFQTPLGLLRLTSLPTGFTNSPAEFQQCMTFILQDEIPHKANIFIDDLPIKGPKTAYLDADGKPETLRENPGIRRFIWEHAVDMHRIMHRVKDAGGTFSGLKTQICLPEVVILGHKCTPEGRTPEDNRVSKIMNWPDLKNPTSVRGFLGLCGTVRIWIPNYSQLARPLTELTHKNAEFVWDERRQQAFDMLKQLVSSAPALHPIDYQSDRPVILSVDSSYIAAGFILSQVDENGRRRPARYGSLPFNEREAKYSQPKLELYGLYRALQQWRIHLVGVKSLHIEVDAKYIKGMLNHPNLQPNAAINRWIEGILLFDFKLIHVPATNFKGPDALSRRETAPGEETPEYDDTWLDHIVLMTRVPPKHTKKISTTDAILPIKPEFMTLIASGTKNYEYRKYLMDGVTRIWLYEIAPVDAITYMMETSNPRTPGEVQDPTGIGNDDFDKGLKKSKYGYPVLALYQLLDPVTRQDLQTLYGLEMPTTGLYAPQQLAKSQAQDRLHKVLPQTNTLSSYKITTLPSTQERLLRPEQLLLQVQHFLRTLEIPQFPSNQLRKRFSKKASEFFMKAGQMYRRNSDKPPLAVIFDARKRVTILTQAHEELGHKGEAAVFELVRHRFFWPHLRADVHHHVASCHQCQIRSIKKVEVPLTVSTPSRLFQKVYIDVMFMPPSGGYHFIAAVKDDLSGVSEVRALRQSNSKNLAQFFWEQIYCRYGSVQSAVTDNGPEVKGAFETLLKRMKIPQVRISPYNKHANGVVERGHFILREAIVKSCEKDTNGHIKNWHKQVELASFADRITVSSVTGYSPYYLLHGTHPILPFDLSEATFMVDGFKPDMTTSDLLALRIRQLQRHPEDVDRAAKALKKARFTSKEQFEKRYKR